VGSQTLGYTNNRNLSLDYDNAGNVTYDGLHHHYYDTQNHLIQVDSSAIQYAYDGAGRGIRKTAGGTTTFYFYGQTGLMSEFSTSTLPSSATQAASTDRLQYRVGEQTGTAVMLISSDGEARENNRVFPLGKPWLTLCCPLIECSCLGSSPRVRIPD
jgi:YD repeat-containing protein